MLLSKLLLLELATAQKNNNKNGSSNGKTDTCNYPVVRNTKIEPFNTKFLLELVADYTNAGEELFSVGDFMQASLRENGDDLYVDVEICIPLRSQAFNAAAVANHHICGDTFSFLLDSESRNGRNRREVGSDVAISLYVDNNEFELTVSDSKNEEKYGKKLAAPYRFDDGQIFLSPDNVGLSDALFHSGGMNFDVYSCRSQWSEWAACSATCGKSIRIRSRGDETQLGSCDVEECSDDSDNTGNPAQGGCNASMEKNPIISDFGEKFAFDVVSSRKGAGELFSIGSVMQSRLRQDGGDLYVDVEICIPLQSKAFNAAKVANHHVCGDTFSFLIEDPAADVSTSLYVDNNEFVLTVSDETNTEEFGKKLAGPWRIDGAIFSSPDDVDITEAAFHTGGKKDTIDDCRSQWGEWGECGATCGDSPKFRARSLKDGSLETQMGFCNLDACPDDLVVLPVDEKPTKAPEVSIQPVTEVQVRPGGNNGNGNENDNRVTEDSDASGANGANGASGGDGANGADGVNGGKGANGAEDDTLTVIDAGQQFLGQLGDQGLEGGNKGDVLDQTNDDTVDDLAVSTTSTTTTSTTTSTTTAASRNKQSDGDDNQNIADASGNQKPISQNNSPGNQNNGAGIKPGNNQVVPGNGQNNDDFDVQQLGLAAQFFENGDGKDFTGGDNANFDQNLAVDEDEFDAETAFSRLLRDCRDANEYIVNCWVPQGAFYKSNSTERFEQVTEIGECGFQ